MSLKKPRKGFAKAGARLGHRGELAGCSAGYTYLPLQETGSHKTDSPIVSVTVAARSHLGCREKNG